MDTVGFRSFLKAGLDSKSMVSEALQKLADAATRPQSVSVASALSSKTFTSTFSAGFPFFVVTFVCLATCFGFSREHVTFLPATDALNTDQYLPCSNFVPTVHEVL